MSDDANCDIEQNFREIQALLTVNAEIFDRCMGSASKYNDGKSALFMRFGFDVVKVRHNKDAKQTQFITETERTEKTFDMKPLSQLPAGLGGIFIVRYQPAPFNKFIDYRAFFQSVLVLQDEVLEPFLAKLKGHIESIQVTLGEIETWLMANESHREFLEATFDVKLELSIKSNCIQGSQFLEGTPADSDLCATCGRRYDSHCDSFGFHAPLGRAACDFSGERRSRSSSRNNSMRTNRWSSFPVQVEFNAGVDAGGLCCTAFKCKKIHLLKSCDGAGRFETIFSLAKQSDQEKLKKFLEFMDC